MNVELRQASLDDVPTLSEIRNFYIINSHITFDVEPYSPKECVSWFNDHSDGKRYRLVVACDSEDGVLGYACPGRFRSKAAYDTTVEASVACKPAAVGRGLGSLLYGALIEAIGEQDINRIVAGVAQPNPASNALHQRFGFRPVGSFSEVGRKFDRYWDVMWMDRPLKLLEK